jgi:hypothetical protein
MPGSFGFNHDFFVGLPYIVSVSARPPETPTYKPTERKNCSPRLCQELRLLLRRRLKIATLYT